jgi:NADH:ubiquinone oxidoreductase subunit H
VFVGVKLSAVKVATTKYTVEYSAALISLCILVNAVNVVVLEALIRLLFTTGVLLTIKLATDGLSAMGVKKGSLIIGRVTHSNIFSV